MCLDVRREPLSPGVAPEPDPSAPANVQGGEKAWDPPTHLQEGAPSLARPLCGPFRGCLRDQPQVLLQEFISFNTNQSVFIPKRLIFSLKKKKH